VPGRLVGGFVVDQGVLVAPSDLRLVRNRPEWRTGAVIGDLALRFRVRLFHWGLDERLADGVDAAIAPELTARAAQLVSMRHRRRLAAAVERIVREAEATPHPTSSVILRTARDQVTEARTSLLFLAYVLRHAEPVGARGVAIVDRLLTDGGSVLYVGGVRGAVALRVQTALDCLVGPQNASPEAWFSLPDSERGDVVGQR
jgi:hypothetical protein